MLISISTLCCSALQAQQRDELRLLSSSHSRLNAVTGRMINYRPVYEHHGSTLSADSGYIYNDDEGRQFFDAFGKVIITQPSGSVIYADKLHYVAETQLATLTNNVRMVSENSILTTNYLTYNMESSVGTYTGGGRIVNTTDTITSKNAYYFDNTKDAYFRYDVVVRTPDVKIYTDTMRYNSDTKDTYFYGPTNIKGNDGANMYTERGKYNTETEQAWFDLDNLYTEGSKFLRGDSIYYDGVSGNGHAVGNVVFIDTADQYFSYGGEGVYNRTEESITMTRNPLVMTVTRSDSTARDSLSADSLMGDSLLTDSLLADSISEPLLPPDSLFADSLAPPVNEPPVIDTIYLTADTLFSRLILLKDYVPRVFELDREGGELDEFTDESYGDDFGGMDGFSGLDELVQPGDTSVRAPALPPGADTARVDRTALPLDSLEAPPDSLATVLKDTIIQQDTAIAGEQLATDSALLATHIERVNAVPLGAELGHDALAQSLAADSLLRDRAIIPTGGEADSLMAGAIAALSRPSTDTIPSDSLANDTAKTRIIKAYYNVRLFKSDLQAVADSVYYGYPDSMMRFFGRPMIWAQGSQMTSDTIFMQVHNEQLDNMILMGNAFMVNTQLDSTKYNQIKGRRITAFFDNNELDRMFVDGNAESIYYNVDKEKQVYTNMYHSRSSRIKIVVDSNEIVKFVPINRMDSKLYPMFLVPQEAEILDGFVWKPGDRPISKEDLLTRRRPPADVASAVPADSTDTPESPGADDQSPAAGRPITNDSVRMDLPVQLPDSVARNADSSAYIRPPRTHQASMTLARQRQSTLTAFDATNRAVRDRARRHPATAV
ncbi:OstA-like protein [Parapedobacter sp. 10938]|uniref:OstA-like protein n=1 Tax=Parapedobacter flavus TaxID=3110225 RepID=UPI002DBC6C85|nr:OstA-like protein [Parapedobacter sp. 10938]MEC3881389.1 OstA-like protein [Parapedobacter sp. 10938]